jgi:hypothetical protein
MNDTRYARHNELVNKTLLFLHANNLGRFWGNPTGAVKTANGHFQRYGLVGSSDIIGISNKGIFVGIEIKTGTTSVQSKPQKAFQRMIEKQNGLYFLIRSEEQFNILLEVLGNEILSRNI